MPQIATQIYTFFFGIIHPLHSSENPSVSRTSPFWSALETMTTRTNLSKAPGCHFLMSSALTRVWWMLGRVPVTRSLQPMERSGLTQSSANYIWGWFLACAQIDISLVGLLGERKRIRLATSSWISDDIIAKWEQAQSEQSLTTPVGFFSTVSAWSVRIPLFFASTRFCTFRYAKWCTDRASFLIRTETIADTEKKRISLFTFDCAVSLGPRNATGEGEGMERRTWSQLRKCSNELKPKQYLLSMCVARAKFPLARVSWFWNSKVSMMQRMSFRHFAILCASVSSAVGRVWKYLSVLPHWSKMTSSTFQRELYLAHGDWWSWPNWNFV